MLLSLGLPVNYAVAGEYHGVVIRIGKTAGTVEKNVARLFSDRLNEAGVMNTRIESESKPGVTTSGTLLILLGIPGHHDAITRLFDSYRIPGLTHLSPGPEGFLLRMVPGENNNLLIAAGIDDRGCLYAVGEILRRIHCRNGIIEIPEDTDLRAAPAFEIRGNVFTTESSYVMNSYAYYAEGSVSVKRTSDAQVIAEIAIKKKGFHKKKEQAQLNAPKEVGTYSGN